MSISLASHFTQRIQSWTSLKANIASKQMVLQYEDSGTQYTIWAYDGPEVHLCYIWKGTLPDSIIDNGYTQEQNDADKASFETYYKPSGNKPVVPKTADARTLTAASKPDTSKKNFFSHDWTDPTTWYEQSVRVTNEVATDSGDHTTYNLAHANVIDTYHGKLYQEDWLKSAAGATLRVAVTVNDVAKTEQDPHYGSGGDFTVNYVLGKIVFLSALNANDVVKVTYSYATSSRFTIKPDAGKTLMIDFAEVQFSDDVELTDTIKFQPYGYVDVFAPQYLQANGGPYAPGTLIPLGNPLVYKSMTDFQAEATRAYPTYPALGGNGWRGTPTKVVVLDWDYVSATVLRSDCGMEVRIFLEHDVPFGGWYGTATFYCTSQ